MGDGLVTWTGSDLGVVLFVVGPDLVLFHSRTNYVISANLRDWFCKFTKVLIGTKLDKDA